MIYSTDLVVGRRHDVVVGHSGVQAGAPIEMLAAEDRPKRKYASIDTHHIYIMQIIR